MHGGVQKDVTLRAHGCALKHNGIGLWGRHFYRILLPHPLLHIDARVADFQLARITPVTVGINHGAGGGAGGEKGFRHGVLRLWIMLSPWDESCFQ